MIILICLLSIPIAYCATINASSCSQSHVQEAVNSAGTGDTVNVPACSSGATWTSGVDINNKSITIQGAGAGKTVISGSGFRLLGNNNASRVTGFTFNLSAGKRVLIVEEGAAGWRLDHCTINGLDSAQDTFYVLGYGSASVPARGLIDNCTIAYVRNVVYGEADDDAPGGRHRWAEPLKLGTDEAVYVEDCVFVHNNFPGEYNQAIDGRSGSRYVFRFNNLTNAYLEAHSPQYGSRGHQKWEIYKNTIALQPGYVNWYPISLRGGTGVVWGNDLSGPWQNPYVGFDLRRLNESLGVGLCNGSNKWDGNLGDSSNPGWPCRDQIGTSTDRWLWTSANPYPPQALAPAYLWSNTYQGASMNVKTYGQPGVSNYIRSDRDYYQPPSGSFNGTSGVGVGTLANRPATCTAGVGYWATDQGNWNKSGSGGQGVLYKCTSNNTWGLYYTPYTYPHPLRNQSYIYQDPSTPAAPSGLKIFGN
jgi:hypothetical protein